MSNTKIQLELDISIKEVDLKVIGSIAQLEDDISVMSLVGALPNAADNLSKILVDYGDISKIITPFVPQKLSFGIYKISNKAKSLGALQLEASYSMVAIKGIFAKEFKLFSANLTQEINFGDLPLVGEYLKDYGISDLGLVYIMPPDSKDDTSKTDNKSELIIIAEKQFVDHAIWVEEDKLSLTSGFNAGILLKDGSREQKITYPGFGFNDNKVPAAQATSGTPSTTSSTPSITPQKQAVEKKSLVKINDVKPSIEDSKINIAVSAEFNIGPFGLQLIGLGVQVPFSAFQDFNIDSLWKSIKFSLQGLAIIYDTPALSISGAFLRESYTQKSVIESINTLLKQLHLTTTLKEYTTNFDTLSKEISSITAQAEEKNTFERIKVDLLNNFEKLKQLDDEYKSIEEYNGLITFKMAKIEIIAIGSYIKTPTYSSLFAFGYLGIPIPIDPAFYIHGFALGFGLNRNFIMPNITDIPEFPLIKIVHQGGLKPGDDIKKIFQDLNRYLPALENNYVIIAGIKFDSYKMIFTTGIVAVAFGTKTSINLLGLSTMGLVGVYNFEFAFSLRADLDEGTFMAQGQLTDKTFILLPQLKLTGGFALGMWLKGENAGDFVFTLGGYHPKFKVPTHYPFTPRLGFSFKMGSVDFYGNAYFALTPSCIMAGIAGGLHLVLDGDVVYAEVSVVFSADFIIYWKPFYYNAEIYVQIYAKVVIDIWLLSINKSFNLAAKLSVEGPEFRGIATFKVAGYELEVKFGDHNKKINKSLTQVEFVKAYLPDLSKILTYNITSGILKKIKTSEGKETIVVNPKTFSLDIYSEIPITTSEGGPKPSNLVTTPTIYPAYKESNELKNTLTLSLLIDDKDKEFSSFVSSPIIKSVPKSIWNNTKETSKTEALSNDNLLKNVCKGIRLEFSKVESKISPTSVSLYDVCVKNYSDDVKKVDLKYTIDNVKLDSEFMNKFEILNQDEIDYTDLENDIDVYKYKSKSLVDIK